MVLKPLQCNLCPVRVYPRWVDLTTDETRDRSMVFGPHLGTRLERTQRLVGTERHMEGSRSVTPSLRFGGAPAMFTA